MNFERQKKKQLNMKDKSSKGSWDPKILSLVNKLNKKKQYYTTSSCSGRIILIKDSEEKKPSLFLFVSHNKLKYDKLMSEIKKIKYKGLVWFKLDSCILHVACRSLDDAQELVDKAKLVGWKKSGIIAAGKRKVVELISTESMSFPLMSGESRLDDSYLKLVLRIANEKLEKIWLKIEKLQKLI